MVLAVAAEPRDGEKDFRRMVLPGRLIGGGGGIGWIAGLRMTERRTLCPPP